VEGDVWHMLKNRGKHFRGHVDAYMPRELPSKREQQARDADKPDRPSDLELATPKLGKPPTPAPLPSLEQMREELVAYGEALPGRGDAAAEAREIGSLHVALRAVQHAKTAIDELEGDPLPPKRGTDLPLTAYASQLASFYKVCARQSVMDQKELAAWADYDDYCHLQADAVASRAERTQRNKSLKQARLAAGAWERNLRSVYNYIFKCAPSLTPLGCHPSLLTPHPHPSPLAPTRYTKWLAGQINAATGSVWTAAERTAEAQRLYPSAALHLLCGMVNHQSLLTVGHPATKQKEAERSWKPPAAGFVKVGSLVWQIMEGWVRDPRCLDKFSFYINDRSTACAVRPT
jgi:hypothetical protein